MMETLRGPVAEWILLFNRFIIIYFFAFNSTFLVLVATGGWELIQARRRSRPVSLEEVFGYPLTPAISVVVPAFNEATTIVDSVHGMLNLRYPSHEVVVVDDGSTDATFELLTNEFDLVEVDFEPPPPIDPETAPVYTGREIGLRGAVRSVHRSRVDDRLVVVRKDNGGTRADAVNAGILHAVNPLVCMTDADSIFDRDAMLLVAAAYLRDPERIVGIGGTLRAANGSTVVRGQLEKAQAPPTWMARIQVVEYLRSFLLGRMAWSRLKALIIVSGAFGVYRRDLLLGLGGLDGESLAEDAELVIRLHYHLRNKGSDHRLAFLPDPVCWTEVPRDTKELGKQRRRWSMGLAQTLWIHRRMLFNPRYGRIGMIGLPYYLVFELLGALVEFVGIWAIIGGYALGLINTDMAILFALVALLYTIVLSAGTILIEEFAFRRYSSWRDLLLVFVSAVVETIGYRQLYAWWRVQGLFAALRGSDPGWEKPERDGFNSAGTGDRGRIPVTTS